MPEARRKRHSTNSKSVSTRLSGSLQRGGSFLKSFATGMLSTMPSTSITVAKGTYITVVGSRSAALAGRNVGYLTSFIDAGTMAYIHIAEVTGDNFEIIGG